MATPMNIEEVALHETAQERYLSYAMSVITSRALPDVRDGLKPVQRRILYAMFTNLKLTHQAKHRKSAAVTGEVMAKYHPHGDQSIYDAMVRMAQDFSMRYPLVDGQGNFGSLDGDSAAAMRYTESRLTQIAGELIDEIRKETVPFRANYDGTTSEPVVLPAQVPNMLINGATGIAVGMATNIPPHNLGEVVDALMALIKKPTMSIEELMLAHFKGPDFPTGGVLLEDHEELLKIYETGHGGVTIRADWSVEDNEASPRAKQIVITSIPYTVTKSSLIEKIADHVMKGKLPQIDDVRDESTSEVRVVLELKRGSDPNAAMAYLFKYTPLQHRFHINLTCLVPTENEQVCAPARLNVKEILHHFLDFRMQVITRRLEFDLAQLKKDIHRLEGFETIFNDLDRALALIRSADGKADAAKKLMAHFALSEVQTESILETKLYRLAKLEIEQIRADLKVKRKLASGLERLLADEGLRWREVRNELRSIRSAYGDARRTRISEGVRDLEFSEENYIINESAIVIVTKDGWFKRQKSYTELATIRVRDGDEVRWALPAKTRDTVVFFTTHGSAYTMRVNDVPSTSGYGDPVQAKFDFTDGEKIVGVMTSHKELLARYEHVDVELKQMALMAEAEAEHEEGVQMMAIGEQGFGVRFSLEPFLEPSTVRGRACMKLVKGELMVNCEPCRGDEIVAVATRDGRGMTFMAREVASYKNVAKGVKTIALDKKDTVLDFTLCAHARDGLEVETSRGSIQGVRASLSKFSPIARGNRGQWIIHKGHLIRSIRPPVEVRFDLVDEEDAFVEEVDVSVVTANDNTEEE